MATGATKSERGRGGDFLEGSKPPGRSIFYMSNIAHLCQLIPEMKPWLVPYHIGERSSISQCWQSASIRSSRGPILQRRSIRKGNFDVYLSRKHKYVSSRKFSPSLGAQPTRRVDHHAIHSTGEGMICLAFGRNSVQRALTSWQL